MPAYIWIAGGGAATAGAACYGTNCGQALANVMESRGGSGAASSPRPHSHHEENSALGFPPGGNCDDLRHAIEVLKDTIAWRKTDLNIAHIGTQTYVDHQKRIKILREKLQQLEKELDNRSDCKPDCLPEM